MKAHLADYKVRKLAITGHETWRNGKKKYYHILPASQRDLNFLSNYRADIQKYINDKRVKLHQYFHHLNSSQAVCFNFFYPLIAENQLPLLLKALQLDGEEVENWKFEKMMGEGERTNFDFYLKLKSGREVLFEIKYTENGFGKVTNHIKYEEQYQNVYQKMLAGKIRPEIEERAALKKNYQLLRNIAYIEPEGNRLLVVICPEHNKKLHKEYNLVIDHIVEPRLHKNIQMITWELLLEQINNQLLSDQKIPGKLVDHYREFEEKYFPSQTIQN
ncbi:PGN_0703 family putative restriction endonuclease [Planococcus sp. 1R117A]|uniref:PGN_0703 family putative restriction endonuclease n=1 Tax=Planococcus sp. 1R117A TaxID=3447020 RepID=UPI003EDBDCE2